MTAQAFELGFDEDRSIQHIRLVGLWDMAQFERFQAATALAMMTHARRGKPWDVLIDARAFAVQPPPVADRFESLLVAGRQVNTGYTAIVTASMLGKIQAERALHHERLRAFLDPAAAAAWLADRRARHGQG